MSRQGVAQKVDMTAAMTADDLKAWRQTMGLSQRTAAAALGVSSPTVERWELGVTRIDIRTALACAALHAGMAPWGSNRSPPRHSGCDGDWLVSGVGSGAGGYVGNV